MSRISLFLCLCVFAWAATGYGQDLLLDLFDVTGKQDRELLRTAQLSPTGTTVSWTSGDDVLCLLDVAAGGTSCWLLPEQMAVPIPFRWSEDGQSLAGTEDVFQFLQDPDIWVIDVASESVMDCTDDGVWGGYLGKKFPVHWIDILPTWNPLTGELLFFRSESSDEGSSLDLMRLPPGSCTSVAAPAEPVVVASLAGILPAGLPLLGHASVSPNGSYLAFIVLVNSRDEPASGIWVVDLKEGAPRHLASADAFRRPAAEWHDPVDAFPMQVAWTSEGSGLVVFVGDLSFSGDWPSQNICYLDLASGSVEYLFSYDGFENRDEFLAADADGHTGVFLVPRQGILLRGSNRLISVHTDVGGTEATFFVQRLPRRPGAPWALGSVAVDPGAARYSQYDPQLTLVSDLVTTLLFARYVVSFADSELGEQ